MPEVDPTCIGRVRHVLGARVTVELDSDLAGIAPIFRGRLQPVGQIGSLVRLPQGLVDLVGQVSLLGIAELAGAQVPSDVVQAGQRWLQIQLLGEVGPTGRFQRGVGTYPGLDDPVHFATADDLRAVFPPEGYENLRIGCLAAAEEVPVCLAAGPLVIRHSAVVGSTGAGKTSAVASLLQGFARRGWPAANIVVIDPHGEYPRALGEDATVRSVLPEGEALQLHVPFWALPASDILEVFARSTGGPTTINQFQKLVVEARRNFVEAAKWLELDLAAVTADTPVPFDLRSVWHRLDYENNETRRTKPDPDTACVEDWGDATNLAPVRFTPYGPGGASPFQGPMYGVHGRTPQLLRLGLLDPRLQFLQEPRGDIDGEDPLVEVMTSWLGDKYAVSVLDFSGVPAEASETAIGVVLSLLFELAVRTPAGTAGIGRPRPLLIVLEEAHRYLGGSAAPMARVGANRIAREGRKYGVGLLLVTQRPSELPDTTLAQCGSIVSLRLTNSADQAKVRAALPDNVAELATVLPSLRTGEAVVSGEALLLPARVLVDRPDPLPLAEDPSLKPWRADPSTPDLAPAIAAWRAVYNPEA